MNSGKFIIVFVGAFVALAAGVPADRLKRQIPGMPDGMPMPPMPMLNRMVRQAGPDGGPPKPGFMVAAAAEFASENGLARVARQADIPDKPPARVVRQSPFHSESSKQVAQEVVYTNVVSVQREKRSAEKKME